MAIQWHAMAYGSIQSDLIVFSGRFVAPSSHLVAMEAIQQQFSNILISFSVHLNEFSGNEWPFRGVYCDLIAISYILVAFSGCLVELVAVYKTWWPFSCVQQPFSNIQLPINDIQWPTNYIQGPINAIQRPTNHIQLPISDMQWLISDIQRPISDIYWPISDIQWPISDIYWPISGIQWPFNGISGQLIELVPFYWHPVAANQWHIMANSLHLVAI